MYFQCHLVYPPMPELLGATWLLATHGRDPLWLLHHHIHLFIIVFFFLIIIAVVIALSIQLLPQKHEYQKNQETI